MTQSKQKTLSVRYIAQVGVLTAAAAILMFLEFPLPFFPPWLGMNFSDVPALIGGFALGPWAAVLIELLKNLINILLKGLSFGGVGDLASFLVGVCLCVPAAIVYRRHHTRRVAVWGMLVGVALTLVVSALTNVYFLAPAAGITPEALTGVMTPMLAALHLQDKLHPMAAYALVAVVPFNLIRSGLEVAATVIIYKPLSHWIHR